MTKDVVFEGFDTIIDQMRAAIAKAYQRGAADERSRFSELLKPVLGESGAAKNGKYKTAGADTQKHQIISATGEAVLSSRKGKARKAVTSSGIADEKRIRAPRGSVELLVRRVLTQRAQDGAALVDFMDARAGDLEQMIKEVSLRSELNRGVEKGRYIYDNSRWVLAAEPA